MSADFLGARLLAEVQEEELDGVSLPENLSGTSVLKHFLASLPSYLDNSTYPLITT